MSCEIEIRNLKKVFADGTEALAGISLKFPRSQTTSIVGPSGSGKSTALKIVAGLSEPTSGEVLFDGKDVTFLAPEKRNIGMVFQSYALFPNMTVQENVEFGLLVRKVPKAERARRGREALEMVQIAHLGHRKIRQLSGGQQQRVALARAVVFKPDILLLDEPLSSLDAKIREELRAELARLLRQFKITAIYVTHDQAEAMALGEQVVVLDRGVVMQMGTPYEIYARPRNGFVAKFIGTANLFPGDLVVSGNGHVKVRFKFGEIVISADEFRQRWPELQPGPLQLLFRPQDVEIVEMHESHAQVKVKETLFLGDRVRISAETSTSERLLIEARNSVRSKVGDSVPIRIDVNSLHLLPPDGAMK